MRMRIEGTLMLQPRRRQWAVERNGFCEWPLEWGCDCAAHEANARRRLSFIVRQYVRRGRLSHLALTRSLCATLKHTNKFSYCSLFGRTQQRLSHLHNAHSTKWASSTKWAMLMLMLICLCANARLVNTTSRSRHPLCSGTLVVNLIEFSGVCLLDECSTMYNR